MPAKLFWAAESGGYRIADVTTDTELEGKTHPALHDAWLDAHERGLRVVLVQATRGTIKRPKVRQLSLPVPTEGG
jgi:hypothetical protein